MISGFNTDIEHNGTVYHVQTEDKGLKKRVIMSLVYDKGTILASKRDSYDDLMTENFDSKVLADRVGRQHKLICAAVRAGRLRELREMSAKSPAGTPVLAEVSGTGIPRPGTALPVPTAPPQATPEPPSARIAPPVPISPVKISIVETQDSFQHSPASTFADGPVIEAMAIIEDDDNLILPAEAVEVVSELSGQERPTHAKLSLELLGETKFKGGDRRTVNIMICRGTARKVVGNAQIMIKVLGSSFRPVIFHAKSDSNGLAKVHLQLPHFQVGRAALLVRAMADGEEIELRRIVTPG